jgi:hypothetical protein
VVSLKRRSRAARAPSSAPPPLFYRVLNRVSHVDIPVDVGDFRLLSRRAVDALKRLPERNRYMKGLFALDRFLAEAADVRSGLPARRASQWPL